MDNPVQESSNELDVFSAAEGIASLLPDGEPDDEQQQEVQSADATADESQGEESQEEQQAEPQKVTVKVDGKDIELTPDEIAEAYKGQLRQADYTRKTMEAAEQRKAADAEIAKARQEREDYANKLQGFANQATYELQALKAQLTDELLESDPVEYMRKQRIAEMRHAELVQAGEELQKVNNLRAQDRAEAERRHFAEQQEQLLAKLPEWKDPAKAKAEVAKIKDYLASVGYSGAEADFTDHRAVILARKAMQFDELTAKAKEATKKIAAVPPKVERPGNAESQARPGDGRTVAMKRLQKTGSIYDAAALIEQII